MVRYAVAKMVPTLISADVQQYGPDLLISFIHDAEVGPWYTYVMSLVTVLAGGADRLLNVPRRTQAAGDYRSKHRTPS